MQPAPAMPKLDDWFPVAFAVDLDRERPTRVTVHGRGFVLFAGDDGAWSGLPDRCPHRAARLSDGRCIDGRIECLYHGWRFDRAGTCVAIPQLGDGTPPPSGAHLAAQPLAVVDGLVWLWAGDPARATDAATIARVEALARADVHVIDYVTDLPYAQDAFVENVLDFAHIHVAHDGARGGGHRHHAGPLAFEVDDRGAEGFGARFLSEARGDGGARPTGAEVHYDAPHLVHYVSRYDDDGLVSGLALYSLPLDAQRSRMLYRAYGNHWPDADRRRPRWREHLFQMALLEQDMAVVTGQVAELAADPRPLREAWLPLKSSDELVVRHRRAIDEHRADGDATRGWATGGPTPRAGDHARDRWTLHTRHCGACRAALDAARRARSLGARAAFVALVGAAVAPWPWSALGGAAALAGGWCARRARRVARALTSGPDRDAP